MTEPQAADAPNPDLFARVIILVYGVLESNAPFWCYVAVKPSKYQKFLDAQKEGTLNLYEFAPFGEVIVSGEGQQPPEAVTLKVAEVYQTDPKNFAPPAEPSKEEVLQQAADADKKLRKKLASLKKEEDEK